MNLLAGHCVKIPCLKISARTSLSLIILNLFLFAMLCGYLIALWQYKESFLMGSMLNLLSAKSKWHVKALMTGNEYILCFRWHSVQC